MGLTIQVARDRAYDKTKTVLPAEVARGIYITTPPSLAALKLMHLMIATAGGSMAEDMRHETRLSTIRQINGMRHHDRASLTPLFEELTAATLRHDDTDNKIETIGGFLDEVSIDYGSEANGELRISWLFRSTFKRMAAASNHWAIVDRQTVFHLTSRYAVLLFQHISSLLTFKHVKDKTFSVTEIRALLGVPEGKHKRFAELNRWAIKPAIAEINKLSRFTLTVTPRKAGRTINSIEIAWSEKSTPLKSHVGKDLSKPKSSSQSFPEDGGITYLPYWIAIKHAAGCNRDDELVADDFRKFCLYKKIPLSSRNIEAIFSGYCKKLGKV